jgi:hypothetical protein
MSPFQVPQQVARDEVTMQSSQNPIRFHKFVTFIYCMLNDVLYLRIPETTNTASQLETELSTVGLNNSQNSTMRLSG